LGSSVPNTGSPLARGEKQSWRERAALAAAKSPRARGKTSSVDCKPK